MSNPLSLATALLNAAKAAVNADEKLGIKMREVLNLLVSCGFNLAIDSKIVSFTEIITEFAKSTNPQIMEIFTMIQEQQRLKREGNDGSEKASQDKKRLQAKAVLDTLDSKWRSICRYEIGKLKDAAGKKSGEEADARLNTTKEAAKSVALFLAADPATLEPQEKELQESIKAMFAVIDGLSDTLVLAVRQHTFDVMKERKAKAEAAPDQDAPKLEKTGTEN